MDEKKKISTKNIAPLEKKKTLISKIFKRLIKAEINFNIECYEKTFHQFKKLAKQKRYEAMHYLGYMFQYGLDVKPAYKDSIKWYKRAIECGNVDSLTDLTIVYRCSIKIDLYQDYLKKSSIVKQLQLILFMKLIYYYNNYNIQPYQISEGTTRL